MILIVGLGNIGSQYFKTRHNIGFEVVDELIKSNNFKPVQGNFRGELFQADEVFILKPSTFMNLSGESVSIVKNKFNFEKIIIVHDELDLPFGAIRFKVGGSSAGHRGIASLDEETQKTAVRVRLGISNNSEERKNTVEFVLSKFNSDEMKCFDKWISLAKDAIIELLKHDWQKVASTKSQKSALGFCQDVWQ